TFVLSRQPQNIPGVRSFTDLEILQNFETDKVIWIAGGAEIYRQTLWQCDELFLTRVHLKCEGDTYFPVFEDRFELAEILHKHKDFTIERWVRSHR
ncbi:MAG: dihydrofolate reductase, partial [Opitutales bacterium]